MPKRSEPWVLRLEVYKDLREILSKKSHAPYPSSYDEYPKNVQQLVDESVDLQNKISLNIGDLPEEEVLELMDRASRLRDEIDLELDKFVGRRRPDGKYVGLVDGPTPLERMLEKLEEFKAERDAALAEGRPADEANELIKGMETLIAEEKERIGDKGYSTTVTTYYDPKRMVRGGLNPVIKDAEWVLNMIEEEARLKSDYSYAVADEKCERYRKMSPEEQEAMMKPLKDHSDKVLRFEQYISERTVAYSERLRWIMDHIDDEHDPETGKPNLFMPMPLSMLEEKDRLRIADMYIQAFDRGTNLTDLALAPYFTHFLWYIFDAHPEVFEKGMSPGEVQEALGNISEPKWDIPWSMRASIDPTCMIGWKVSVPMIWPALGPGQYLDREDFDGGYENGQELEWGKFRSKPPKYEGWSWDHEPAWRYYPKDVEHLRAPYQKLKEIVGQLEGLPGPAEFTEIGWWRWKRDHLGYDPSHRDFYIVASANTVEDVLHPGDTDEKRRARLSIGPNWNNGAPLPNIKKAS